MIRGVCPGRIPAMQQLLMVRGVCPLLALLASCLLAPTAAHQSTAQGASSVDVLELAALQQLRNFTSLPSALTAEQQKEMVGTIEDQVKIIQGNLKETMSHESRLHGVKFVSKLKNAIHLIKKGALSGNSEAQAGLTSVFEG